MKRADVQLGGFYWHKNGRSICEITGFSGMLLRYREWPTSDGKIEQWASGTDYLSGACQESHFVQKCAERLTSNELRDLDLPARAAAAARREAEKEKGLGEMMKAAVLESLTTDEVRELARKHGIID
jgi:hypothetical protein